MILLDTDHLTVLRYPESPTHTSLLARMQVASGETYATTIVTVEEQMRGWLALIRRLHEVHKQIPVYERLAKLLDFFVKWQVVLFDNRAADEFVRLRETRLRIGTQDLKIASIARAHDALLLSANLRDFRRVPGLRVQNWLE